jgi:hypothetical protein
MALRLLDANRSTVLDRTHSHQPHGPILLDNRPAHQGAKREGRHHSTSCETSSAYTPLHAPGSSPANLFNEYVSRGGGVSRCWSITGMSARMSCVICAHSVPGPNVYGWCVLTRKGVPRSCIDLTCAKFISCSIEKPDVLREQTKWGLSCGTRTNLVLLAGEVA